MTTAAEIVKALRRHHYGAALVTELETTDAEVQAFRREMYARQGRWNMTDEESAKFWTCLTRRIDVLMVHRQQRTAIEIKVTRADFRRETEEKRRAWRAITHRFVYACPPGIIRPEEVPDGIGLWWVDVTKPWYEAVTVMKRAKINKEAQPLPEKVVSILCYRAMKREKEDARA